jgi:hypothetical protein
MSEAIRQAFSIGDNRPMRSLISVCALNQELFLKNALPVINACADCSIDDQSRRGAELLAEPSTVR